MNLTELKQSVNAAGRLLPYVFLAQAELLRVQLIKLSIDIYDFIFFYIKAYTSQLYPN